MTVDELIRELEHLKTLGVDGSRKIEGFEADTQQYFEIDSEPLFNPNLVTFYITKVKN